MLRQAQHERGLGLQVRNSAAEIPGQASTCFGKILGHTVNSGTGIDRLGFQARVPFALSLSKGGWWLRISDVDSGTGIDLFLAREILGQASTCFAVGVPFDLSLSKGGRNSVTGIDLSTRTGLKAFP